MTRRPGELPEAEEALLGIERPTPEQEAEAKREADLRQEIREKFLRGLMGSHDFRQWLMEHLTAFNTFGISFGHGPNGFPDRDGTMFALGMKAAGWAIYEQLDSLIPDLVSQMRREFKNPLNQK